MKGTALFDRITVNVNTGALAYPALPGFKLDTEAVYRVARLFLPHCNGDLELAVKHAVHGQLAEHQGACQLFPEMAKETA